MTKLEFVERLREWMARFSCPDDGFSEEDGSTVQRRAHNALVKILSNIPGWGDCNLVPEDKMSLFNENLINLSRLFARLFIIDKTPSQCYVALDRCSQSEFVVSKMFGANEHFKVVLPTSIVETGIEDYVKSELNQKVDPEKTLSDTNEGMIPHIKVSVKIGDEEVSQHCAQFIDAISFLCHCELCIRRNKKMTEPVDIQTSAIQQQNLKKLLGERN